MQANTLTTSGNLGRVISKLTPKYCTYDRGIRFLIDTQFCHLIFR
jgi:hypothetical protein